MASSTHRPTSSATNSWASALRETLADREVKPTGSGWITMEDLRADLKLSRPGVYQFVADLKKSGRVDEFRGLLLVNNKLTRQIWYRMKQ